MLFFPCSSSLVAKGEGGKHKDQLFEKAGTYHNVTLLSPAPQAPNPVAVHLPSQEITLKQKQRSWEYVASAGR